jgi:hypothetical protein
MRPKPKRTDTGLPETSNERSGRLAASSDFDRLDSAHDSHPDRLAVSSGQGSVLSAEFGLSVSRPVGWSGQASSRTSARLDNERPSAGFVRFG